MTSLQSRVTSDPAAGAVAVPKEWLDTAALVMPDIARDIVQRIRVEVAEYADDADGRISADTRNAVREALTMFMTSMAWGMGLDKRGAEVFRRLGRMEARAGRSHESLQCAYRVASQSVMRQLLSWQREHNAPADVMASLSSAVFAFIDELARLSAAGYSEARATLVDQVSARGELLGLLVHRDGYSRRAVADAAERVSWTLPHTVTLVEIVGRSAEGLFDPQALVGNVGARSLAALPGPVDVVDLRRRVIATGADVLLVVGPTVPLAEVGSAARLAHRLRSRFDVRERAIDGVAVCDDCLVDLLVDSNRDAARVLASKWLKPLVTLSPAKRVKYGRLLSAWLEHGTLNADEPGILDKHRQTLRYQCGQLEKMFGDALVDRTSRLEIMLALRGSLPLWERQAAGSARRG